MTVAHWKPAGPADPWQPTQWTGATAGETATGDLVEDADAAGVEAGGAVVGMVAEVA
jgi:hypothetical protein